MPCSKSMGINVTLIDFYGKSLVLCLHAMVAEGKR